MKTSIILFTVATITTMLSACSANVEQPKKIEMSNEQLVKKGKYLMVVAACHDCHSPKVMTHEGPMPDTTRLLSGHPKDEKNVDIPANSDEWILFNHNLTRFVGPWGVSYAANLTPHETGTKHWTLEQFKTALRKGKYKGLENGRDLLPPMPWQMYRNMTDDDMLAIDTYLRSIKPIDNRVPDPVLKGAPTIAATERTTAQP